MGKGNDIAMGMVIGAGKNKNGGALAMKGGLMCPDCAYCAQIKEMDGEGCPQCGVAMVNAPAIRINKNALGMP